VSLRQVSVGNSDPLHIDSEEKTMQKEKQLMEGYDIPTAQEVADYNHFRADRFPSLSQLEIVDEPEAPPSMALYVLAGRRMDV